MSIGSKIKMYRKERRMTQTELATKSNISRSYLADVEGDRYNPSLDTLEAISRSLKVPLSSLLNDDSDTFMKNVMELLKERGSTFEELGNAIGESQFAILRYGKDVMPSENTISKIAQFFGVTVNKLMHNKNSNSDDNEKEFISRIDLTDEQLIKDFTIEVDGRPLSEREMKKVIAQIRLDRQFE